MGIKKCPNCAEEIQEEAKYCIHCKKNIQTGFFVDLDKKIIITIVIILMILTTWLFIDPQSLFKTLGLLF
ncbi:MAG: zinc ribbon domain-containing protein [Candidatus Gracilibacteria bacterium]|nr:zinc ribbon domain-containing protein [Candidatus Gracilibacteria bacterium]